MKRWIHRAMMMTYSRQQTKVPRTPTSTLNLFTPTTLMKYSRGKISIRIRWPRVDRTWGNRIRRIRLLCNNRTTHQISTSINISSRRLWLNLRARLLRKKREILWTVMLRLLLISATWKILIKVQKISRNFRA